MINRHVFHRQQTGSSFLTERLQNAVGYDRIAGYFDSSLLEFAGEAFENVNGSIRIICNSRLNPDDVRQAVKAEHEQKVQFLSHDPGELAKGGKERLQRLAAMLTSSQLEVRVLPDKSFGMIHGKAGVITREDGSRTSFLGSTNETWAGWNLNYELVWEDDSEEACQWVENEFLRLWEHHHAVPLSKAVLKEVERLVDRTELPLETWIDSPSAPGIAIESPVYREQFGLWPHQRYFVDQAWRAHQTFGARYILADQVGLGKTVQLAMVAQLVALSSAEPVLVLLPKTLMEQWQTELWDLMEIPTARWTGRLWIDEVGMEHPPAGKGPIGVCPRAIGLISHGLVVRNEAVRQYLLGREWSAVIVDEAHRARRRKIPKLDDSGKVLSNPDTEANRLYSFLFRIAPKARSMLLATATPLQLHPIEAWDLLRVLAEGNDHVLGSLGSRWRQPSDALPYLLGQAEPPKDNDTLWDWLKNPLPPSWEHANFDYFRRRLEIDDSAAVVIGDYRLFHSLPPDIKTRMGHAAADLFDSHHPFLRHIIRRTRSYLENEVDPKTKEPYLQPVYVKLIDDEPVYLESYLADGYKYAEEFCKLLAKRVKSAGFFKTLLLRRIGSSIRAGLSTVERMLSTWETDFSEEEEESDEELIGDESDAIVDHQDIRSLTVQETALLQQCRNQLQMGLERLEEADPKLDVILRYLRDYEWVEAGCILFSQYLDTARWIGERIAAEFPEDTVGLYAGANRSGVWSNGVFHHRDRETLKAKVRSREIRVLVGTDAASEGLNLQALGTLINIDLPWNPTRLEQRKGRIQRIGQSRDTIEILNLRYRGSVEDKVHESLSGRLKAISELFGQIPDVLKDVWVQVALDNQAEAERLIDDIAHGNPFDQRYSNMGVIPEWDGWSQVLNKLEKVQALKRDW